MWLRGLVCIVAFLPVLAYSAIVDKAVFNNVVYLLDDTNRKVHRYDMNAETFLTAITLTGTDTPVALDTADGTNIYVGMDRDVRLFTIAGDDTVTQTTFRRFSSFIQDLDVNGNFLVAAIGNNRTSADDTLGISAGADDFGELQVVSLTDATIVSRGPAYPEGTVDPKYPKLLEMNYHAAAGKYYIRSAAVGGIWVDYNATTGVLTNFNDGSSSFIGTIEGGEDATMYFLPELNLSIDELSRAYYFDAPNESVTTLYELPDETAGEFFQSSELIVTDSTVDFAATDGSAFYVALTIDNLCNLAVEGTRVSVNTHNGETTEGVSFVRNIDFTQSLEEMALANGNLYGFYFNESDSTIMEVSIKPSSEEVSDWVDTTIADPNTELFTLRDYEPYGDKVVVQLDEGCKHFLLEYNPATGTYTNQIETFWEVESFVTDPTNGVIYWTNQYETGNEQFDGDLFMSTPEGGRSLVKSYKAKFEELILIEPGVLLVHYHAPAADTATYAFDYIDMNNRANDRTGLVCTSLCNPWTGVTVNPENKNLVIAFDQSGEQQMFYFDLPAWLAGTEDVIDYETSPFIRTSVHYGVLGFDTRSDTTTKLAMFVINDVKNPPRDLVYIGGNFYDLGSNGILVDDFADPTHLEAVWTGSSLYTTERNTSGLISRWAFNTNLELVGVSDQLGLNRGLALVSVNGAPTPVLLTQNDGESIIYVTDLNSSETGIDNNTAPEAEGEDGGGSGGGGSGGGGGGTLSEGSPLSCGAQGCVTPNSGSFTLLTLFGLLSLVVVRNWSYRKSLSLVMIKR